MDAAAHFFCFMLKFECHLGKTYYSGMIIIGLINCSLLREICVESYYFSLLIVIDKWLLEENSCFSVTCFLFEYFG